MAVRSFLIEDALHTRTVWSALARVARWGVEKAAGTAVETVVESRVEAWLRRQAQQAQSEDAGNR